MSSKAVPFTDWWFVRPSLNSNDGIDIQREAWWQRLNEGVMALGVCIVFALIAGVVGAGDDEFRGLFPAVVVFGDSTVDAGNNNYLNTPVKSNFPPYGVNYQGGMSTGRFTDGFIAPDLISLKLGIPLQLPYLSPKAHGEAILTGVNFASSASGWNEDTDNIYNVKGITTQLKWYKSWKAEVLNVAGPEKGDYIIKNALYIISTGTNDWVNHYYLSSNLQNRYTTDQWTAVLIDLARKAIQELYASGARNIAVLGLPPFGCLPEQITFHLGNDGCVKALNDVAVDFNKKFETMIEDLKKTMPGSRLILSDTLAIFVNAFENPQKYGFKYARTACCGTGDLEVSWLCSNRVVPTCSNPDEHMFWDSFHPTSHFYRVLTDELIAVAIPLILAPPTST